VIQKIEIPAVEIKIEIPAVEIKIVL